MVLTLLIITSFAVCLKSSRDFPLEATQREHDSGAFVASSRMFYILAFSSVFAQLVPRTCTFIAQIIVHKSQYDFMDSQTSKVLTLFQMLGNFFTELSLNELDNRFLFTKSKFWIRYVIVVETINLYSVYLLVSQTSVNDSSKVIEIVNTAACFLRVCLVLYLLINWVCKFAYFHTSEAIQVAYSTKKLIVLAMSIICLAIPTLLTGFCRIVISRYMFQSQASLLYFTSISYIAYNSAMCILNGVYGILLVHFLFLTNSDINAIQVPKKSLHRTAISSLLEIVAENDHHRSGSSEDSFDRFSELSNVPACGHTICLFPVADTSFPLSFQ
jgi:hypothetical protein